MYIYIYICVYPPATGKYFKACFVPQLGEMKHSLLRKDRTGHRVSVQFEKFQYNLVLW